MNTLKNRIRAGVVGVGYLGRWHAEKYAGLDNVELAGVVDVDEKQSAAVAEKEGTRAYTDYRELFGLVDAVSIAVPTPLHYEVAKAFLEKGVDVLIEKPITTTVKQADELIGIAARNNKIIQVGHLERFNPAVVSVRDLISEPVFIESNRLSIYQPRGSDVSVVHDLMIHDIDLILHFVKSGVRYCHALGTPLVTDSVDIANAHIEFDNGATANVTASRISGKTERKIRLFQKDGYISIDFANRAITHIRRARDGEENCAIPGMHMENRNFAQADALKEEIVSFVGAVETRSEPEVSGQMGRDALALAVEIIRQIDVSMTKIKSR